MRNEVFAILLFHRTSTCHCTTPSDFVRLSLIGNLTSFFYRKIHKCSDRSRLYEIVRNENDRFLTSREYFEESVGKISERLDKVKGRSYVAQSKRCMKNRFLRNVSHYTEKLKVRFLIVLWTICYSESDDHIGTDVQYIRKTFIPNNRRLVTDDMI